MTSQDTDAAHPSWARRHRALLVLGAALVALLVVAVILVIRLLGSTPAPEKASTCTKLAGLSVAVSSSNAEQLAELRDDLATFAGDSASQYLRGVYAAVDSLERAIGTTNQTAAEQVASEAIELAQSMEGCS